MRLRDFIVLAGMLVAGTALSPTIGPNLTINPVSIARAAEPAEEDLATLARKYIPYMTKPVSVTLNPQETNVREVTPDDYDRMVYGNKKPSLVLFVRKPDNTTPSADEGLASVFRALQDKYGGKMDFFVYYDNKYPTAPGVNVGSKRYLAEGINATPSIAMYSPFDPLKGETPERNDGKMKKVDILKGGFSKPEMWGTEYKNLDYWIQINTNPSNPDFGKYWLNNSNEWKERNK